MLPFFVLVFVPIIVFLLSYKSGKMRDKYCLATFFALLAAMLILRSQSVGIDVSAYKFYFDKVDGLSWSQLLGSTHLETGYVILIKIFLIFSKDYQLFLGVMAVLALLPVFILYFNESEDGFLTIAIFLIAAHFVLLFSGIRQSVAIGLAVPCYYAVKKKQWWNFIPTVFLAFMIHHSAAILALMYPLYHLKIRRTAAIFITAAIAAIFFFRAELLSLVLEILPGRYKDLYGELSFTGDYEMLLLFAVFTVYSFFIPDENRLPSSNDGQNGLLRAMRGFSRELEGADGSTEEISGLRNFLFLIMLVQTFASVSTIAMRFNYYYMFFLPVLLPKVANAYGKDKFKRDLADLSRVVMIVFFIAYFFYDAYFGADVLQVFPYLPYWKG